MKVKNTKFFNQEGRKWLLVDAKDKVLGRLATRIAKILQGKNKATYTPNSLCGDRIVVINSKHIKVTADKYNSKIYDKYTGYPSGRKEMSLKILMEKNPNRVLHIAVKGMLPKSHLGHMMLKSLKIYSGVEHNHEAQKPEAINI